MVTKFFNFATFSKDQELTEDMLDDVGARLERSPHKPVKRRVHKTGIF
jgi:hypothetical protein